MKYTILLLGLLALSCSGSQLDEELLSQTLIGKGYAWKIQSEDTLINQELYFVNDSLYTTVFEHEGLKYSQPGLWSLTKSETGSYYLKVTDITSTPSLKVDKWDGKKIELSWKDFTYEANQFNQPATSLATDIQGS